MPPQSGSTDGTVPGGSSFPALGQFPKAIEERFLVMERTGDSQTLEKISPFLIDKVIKNCCGDVTSINRIRDGKILIKVKNERQATQLRKLHCIIPGINVAVNEHATLNTCRVVITCRDLLEMKEEDILEEMREEKVIKVERIMKKVGDILIKTASLILTISAPNRPEKIKVGFMRVQTRPHYPRPMRCFQCLKYGHLGRDCKAAKTCANCGDNFHGDNCNKETKCINCQKPHKATSPDCDIWKKEKDIIRLRIDQNLSYLEAKKIFDLQNTSKSSYASKAVLNANGCKCQCTCQKTSDNTAITETQLYNKQPSRNARLQASIPIKNDDEGTPTNTAKSSTSDNSPAISPKQKRAKTTMRTNVIKKLETIPCQEKNTSGPQLRRKPGRPKKKPLPTTQDTTEPDDETSDMDNI
ncbi:uncharacterized protein LOC128739887 [Sabethes cyaneus]|uniref:uncharacterized protein LOC128739887 n=1 Tax=Sabethes cyaneus TaxID=53552 RepID=UPI00237E4177|nr:uncharacterized protein LOC128739887 [Sabethes cyaneus]